MSSGAPAQRRIKHENHTNGGGGSFRTLEVAVPEGVSSPHMFLVLQPFPRLALSPMVEWRHPCGLGCCPLDPASRVLLPRRRAAISVS